MTLTTEVACRTSDPPEQGWGTLFLPGAVRVFITSFEGRTELATSNQPIAGFGQTCNELTPSAGPDPMTAPTPAPSITWVSGERRAGQGHHGDRRGKGPACGGVCSAAGPQGQASRRGSGLLAGSRTPDPGPAPAQTRLPCTAHCPGLGRKWEGLPSVGVSWAPIPALPPASSWVAGLL